MRIPLARLGASRFAWYAQGMSQHFTYPDAERRYLNDPVFHAMVHAMLGWIQQLHLTPGELRDAATFASIKFEMEFGPSPAIFTRPGGTAGEVQAQRESMGNVPPPPTGHA